MNSVNACNAEPQVEQSDAGITVPGSESHQQFHSVSGFALEPQSTVIVLRLRGMAQTGTQVAQPVTVAAKAICGTCGKSNPPTDQFCERCGTAVTII